MQNFFHKTLFAKCFFSLIYAINQHSFIKNFSTKQDKFLSILRAKICFKKCFKCLNLKRDKK